KHSEATPLPAPLPMLVVPPAEELPSIDIDLDAADELAQPAEDPPLPGLSVIELTQRKVAPPTEEPEPILLDRQAEWNKVPTLTGMPPLTIPDPPLASLRATTSRQEVAQVLLDYLAQMAPRVALFVVRRGLLAGFDGRGAVDVEGLKRVEIALGAPSL